MATLILASVLALVLMIALMFSRGGAREPATAMGPSPGRPRLDADQLAKRTEEFLRVRGFSIERREPADGRSTVYIAASAEPMVGGRVYVYTMSLDEPARAADVQSAIDAARGEGLNKAILISPSGFSDEAILSAADTPTELIDGRELDAILRAEPAERG